MNVVIRLRKSCDVGAAATTNNNKLKAKSICVFHLLRRAHKQVGTSAVLIVVCTLLQPYSKENRIKKKIETKSNAYKCTHTHTPSELCVCECIHTGCAYVCVCVYVNTYYVSHLHARPYSIQHIIINIQYMYTHSRFIQQTTHDFQYTHMHTHSLTHSHRELE